MSIPKKWQDVRGCGPTFIEFYVSRNTANLKQFKKLPKDYFFSAEDVSGSRKNAFNGFNRMRFLNLFSRQTKFRE